MTDPKILKKLTYGVILIWALLIAGVVFINLKPVSELTEKLNSITSQLTRP